MPRHPFFGLRDLRRCFLGLEESLDDLLDGDVGTHLVPEDHGVERALLVVAEPARRNSVPLAAALDGDKMVAGLEAVLEARQQVGVYLDLGALEHRPLAPEAPLFGEEGPQVEGCHFASSNRRTGTARHRQLMRSPGLPRCPVFSSMIGGLW